ncbi:MAG: NUDIX domain-containing protein [Oscillochloridaceae bacterium umkhey_bin13]
MNAILGGLREGALTLTYRTFLIARALHWQITRPTHLGVRVLAPFEDQVLLVRHRAGPRPWALPGGGVEHGESLETAALRELYEEAGCAGEVRAFHGLFHYVGGGLSNYTAIFVCTTLGPPLPPVGDLEIVDARFFPLNDLPANMDGGSRRRIAEYARGLHGLYGVW